MGGFLLNAAMSGPVLVPGHVAKIAANLDLGMRQMGLELWVGVILMMFLGTWRFPECNWGHFLSRAPCALPDPTGMMRA